MRQLIVGVGDGTVSCDPDAVLVTYALGSCIAVMMHDPVVGVAGMVHYLLPESSQAAGAQHRPPWVYADTGISCLLGAALAQGADPRRLIIYAAGGAQLMNDNSVFDIGKRNCLAMRKALWKFGLVARAEDIGGTIVRTARMEVGSGRVWLQSPNREAWEMSSGNRLPNLLRGR